MTKKRQRYSCDFETTVDPNDLRVWASCAVNIETLKTEHIGTSIEEFFDFLKDKNTVCYFHNLKFDGEFIISYLLRNGYKMNNTKKPKTFFTLISDMGQWFSITVIFAVNGRQYKKVVFYDSLKKLPFKVAVIAKAFNLPMSKGEIDYKAYRPKGHQLTDEERDYIERDCQIVAQALQIQFMEGLDRMTNASDAMSNFKDIFGKKQFQSIFPTFPLQLDDELRKAYKGGFVYLKPEYKNVRGLQGKTYDVNSLYPWVMRTKLLPYSYPIYFEGEYESDENFPLYIVHMECSFALKPNHLPTIQLKNNLAFVPTDYLESSNGEIVEMFLTSVDLELMRDHYILDDETYFNGWKFRGATGMFDDYIDHWMRIKETTTGAKRQLAKLQLNSLYGKFATNPHAKQKLAIKDAETEIVQFITNTEENVKEYGLKNVDVDEPREPVYTAMGCFITAYARERTIRSGQAVYDRFIYADTDSLHIIGTDEPDIEIHPTKLGAWKDEGTFVDSKYIRAKTYMETTDEGTKITCAGMPDNIKEQVTYDNFCSGSTFNGKLVPKRYKGGVILTETTFTIK